MEFLGHVVSYRGMEPQNAKIEAVVNWSHPQNVHDVIAFLGLSSHYRRFVDSFSKLAALSLHTLEKGSQIYVERAM